MDTREAQVRKHFELCMGLALNIAGVKVPGGPDADFSHEIAVPGVTIHGPVDGTVLENFDSVKVYRRRAAVASGCVGRALATARPTNVLFSAGTYIVSSTVMMAQRRSPMTLCSLPVT